MTEEPWNKHTPGDPVPCKCGDSVVVVKLRNGVFTTGLAKNWGWRKIKDYPYAEITEWRFIERKGEDVIQRCAECDCCGSSECNWIKSGPADPIDPYDSLEWDEDGVATVVLKVPGQPEWVREDDLVRFRKGQDFERADEWVKSWDQELAFQIKRRPALTPAEPQLLTLLAAATLGEACAIRQAARRANIEVPG